MPPRILTTHYIPHRASWASRTTMIDTSRHPVRRVLVHMLRTARRYEAVVVNGTTGLDAKYVDLVAAGIVGHLPSGPAVLVTGCHWKAGSRLEYLLRRVAIRLVDSPRTTYAVLAEDEKTLLHRLWGLPRERIVTTPYQYNLTDEELAAPISDDGGVFSGGDPMRDYAPLLEAAHALPDVPFNLATSRVAAAAAVPPNVTHGRVPHERYVELLRAATVVVVAMQADMERTAGQQTFLNAMALGKPVVVTEGPGVGEYVQHGVTGWIVPPADGEAMTKLLRELLDPDNGAEVRAVAERARESTRERYGPEQHVDALLSATAAAIEIAAGRPRGPA